MSDEELTYEQKVAELEAILKRLDDGDTPIDRLAEDVKTGVRLIRELEAKLREVEHQVVDAFAELDAARGPDGAAPASDGRSGEG
jgi:exodeoxyribonuclease VII small subunit